MLGPVALLPLPKRTPAFRTQKASHAETGFGTPPRLGRPPGQKNSAMAPERHGFLPRDPAGTRRATGRVVASLVGVPQRKQSVVSDVWLIF